MDRNNRFLDKVVIVTGGAVGIGNGAAQGFAREGGAVVIADVDANSASLAANNIVASGGTAIAVPTDVRSSAAVENLVDTAVSTFGGVDVLVNCAGINLYGTVDTFSEEDWDRQLGVNLKGTFLACKYAIPEMRKRGGGSIVNTASVQAFASQRTVAAYAASKGGIVSFTTTVALDHAAENIRCNCIAPGSIRTPMLEYAARKFSDADIDTTIAEWGRAHPIGRVGTIQEVANLILFLASDEASFCTGGAYRVDGGLLSPLPV
jgi:NAD(P)-dependent dehydrogenase (short-subunit alcohol dehydrogenase family)